MRATMLLALTALATATVPSLASAQAAPAVTARSDGAEIATAGATMRVVALTDSILRIRVGRGGAMPEDASWAVDAKTRAQHVAVTPAADGFATKALRVRFRADGRLRIEDLAGNLISEDAAPVAFDGKGFALAKTMPQAEHYFGMGDKTGGLDRRGKSFVDWNTDAFGFGSGDDPIYKSIPFFIGVGGVGGSYGLFLDNTTRAWFDFGHRDDARLAFGAPDGPIDYYLIAGPTTAEVVRRYTDLTGKAPLVPQWALGYQQSRYSYMTADELRGVAARLRQERVPTDVLWLDIDWQDRNRPFTVDSKAFPDMKGLLSDLKRDGFKVVTITDLHVAQAPDQGYRPYDEGIKRDAFVHRADGSVYVGPVWPGPSVFPDFTETKVRDWYGTLFADQVKMGVAGAWNDMNEPAIFNTPTKTMPADVMHRIDSDGFMPRTATHAEIHNVYGMQNTRATYDGLRADLSLLGGAAQLAQDIAALTDRVDLLFNNAGGMTDKLVMTDEGLEANFAGNHLGPFLLTQRLLPLFEHAMPDDLRGDANDNQDRRQRPQADHRRVADDLGHVAVVPHVALARCDVEIADHDHARVRRQFIFQPGGCCL